MTDANQDMLEEVRQLRCEVADFRKNGSRNFRHYRRRAYGAFALLAIVSGLALYLVWHQTQTTRHQAHAQCLQSMRIGPGIADLFEDLGSKLNPRTGRAYLPHGVLDAYRKHIPRRCD